MSYLGFLLLFLAAPIGALMLLQGPQRPLSEGQPGGRRFWLALAVQVILAVGYTTPWDNHLVAHGVWFYAPSRVSGIVLGYVPLEEYVFFVLESILVGLTWKSLMARRTLATEASSMQWRLLSAGAAVILWGAAMFALGSGQRALTYPGLILAWALPPIGLQLLYGADILLACGKRLMVLILTSWLYLSVADALAIHQGIWAIDPAQSTRIMILGLPIEEALFFLVTVVLLAFGLTLSLAPESQARFAELRDWFQRRPASLSDEEQSKGAGFDRTG